MLKLSVAIVPRGYIFVPMPLIVTLVAPCFSDHVGPVDCARQCTVCRSKLAGLERKHESPIVDWPPQADGSHLPDGDGDL